MTFVSIDQNCSPLWDAIPKLAALRAHAFAGVHCIEDVDVAFTQQFAPPGTPPHVAPERFYPNGNSDWGASVFYSDFLGRNAINPRALEPYLHAPVATYAKRAGMTLDELYAAFASSDNFQIIAPSYAGDNRHRTLGDLSLRELRSPLAELVEHAHTDTRRAFPSPESLARTDAFFKQEREFLDRFYRDHPGAMLTDLYAEWMKRHLPGQDIRLSSAQFAGDPHVLLRAFLSRYDTLAPLYNQAIAETRSSLTPLNMADGELPFFALWRVDGQCFRTPVRRRGDLIEADGKSFALDDMRAHGVVALPPKALLLVLHARTTPAKNALALPWQGSLYMPTARRLEALLEPHLHLAAAPVLRVRFRFLEHFASLETPVQPPAWLAPFVSDRVLPANRFLAQLRNAQRDANDTLEALRNNVAELAVLTPELSQRIDALNRERETLARDPVKRARASELWQQQKTLQQQQARDALERIVALAHLVGLDYWDSRGALLPQALALGGPAFYQRLLDGAQIFEE